MIRTRPNGKKTTVKKRLYSPFHLHGKVTFSSFSFVFFFVSFFLRSFFSIWERESFSYYHKSILLSGQKAERIFSCVSHCVLNLLS